MRRQYSAGGGRRLIDRGAFVAITGKAQRNGQVDTRAGTRSTQFNPNRRTRFRSATPSRAEGRNHRMKKMSANPFRALVVEPGINATLAALAGEWNRHDMQAWGELFSEDADFVNVLGMHWEGRRRIIEEHARRHLDQFRDSELVAVGHTARLLAPDVALVHWNWELRGDTSVGGRVRRGIMTLVLCRQGAVWRIRVAHNTDIVAPPRMDVP